MAYVLNRIGTTANTPIKHFTCDTKADLLDIDLITTPMGSTVYIIETGETYMLNSKYKWVLQPRTSCNSGGTGPGDNPYPEDTIYIYDGGGVEGY